LGVFLDKGVPLQSILNTITPELGAYTWLE